MKENSRSLFPFSLLCIFSFLVMLDLPYSAHADVTCGDTQENVGGVCVERCVPPQVRTEGVCTTPTAVPPVAVVPPPTCNETQTLVDGACVNCPSPRTVQGGQCLCPEANQILSGTTCSACPAGATRDSEHLDQCKCTDSGSQLVSGVCQPGWPISEYRWSGGPTIIKTSQFKDTTVAGGGATCGTNYELCMGPATATQGDRTVVRMVKCFMPRNSSNCPEELGGDSNCVFLGDSGEGVGTMRSAVGGADPLIDPSASIPPIDCTSTTPACQGGASDVWDVGCRCAGSAYSFPSAGTTCVRSKSECDTRQARSRRSHPSRTLVPALGTTCAHGTYDASGPGNNKCRCPGLAGATFVGMAATCPQLCADGEYDASGPSGSKCRCPGHAGSTFVGAAATCPQLCAHGTYDAAGPSGSKCRCPGAGNVYVGPTGNCLVVPVIPGDDVGV